MKKRTKGGVVDSSLGPRRVAKLLQYILDPLEFEQITGNDLLSRGESNGIFVNEHTFEISLFGAGHSELMCDTIKILSKNRKLRERADALKANPKLLDPTQFLKDIDTISSNRSRDSQLAPSGLSG